jgi:putative ATP-binding cassette transporter
MKETLLLSVKRLTLAKYVFLSILAALFNFCFIAFINKLMAGLIKGKSLPSPYTQAALFLLILSAFIATRRILAVSLINFSQKMFWELRDRITRLILSSGYEQFRPRREAIQSAMMNDVAILSGASLNVIQFATAVFMIAACFVYMGFLSLVLFSITLLTLGLGMGVYKINMKKSRSYLQKARQLQDKYVAHFNALLFGFREIQLDPAKGADIVEKEIGGIVDTSVYYSKAAFVGLLNNQLTGQVMFYCLIGSIVLFVSSFFHLESSVVISYLFVLLFLLGAVETTLSLFPVILQARVSGKNLLALMEELENLEKAPAGKQDLIGKHDFNELRIRHIRYWYGPSKEGREQREFAIGPIDITINRNETLFIYGSNGSGKTTLILSILGLLKPKEGETTFNGIRLTDDNYRVYRTLFGVVFNDFYLFEKLYGIREVDAAKVEAYLALFELDTKVSFTGGAFSSRDLSTGQRKRLALVATLLENKPVIVLDEWAADQDPHFRKKFYTCILPVLKAEGFTIIAITHDDKYYHCADRLYKMEFGRLTEILSDLKL